MNIFKMEWRRSFKSLVIWAAASTAFVILLMLLYPSMLNSDMMALMNAKLEALPKEFVDAFHMSGQDFTQLPDFFGLIFEFILMAACIYGTILGLSALSREENEGTIEFLYAKPVTRAHIVSMKLLSNALIYFAYFGALAAASIAVSASVKPADLDFMDMVSTLKSVLFGGMMTGFTYFFLGFAVSVFFKKARHVASLAMAIYFGTYLLGTVPRVTGVLEFLKWASPVNYFVPSEIILNGIDLLNTLICFAAMAVCASLAYGVYRRKDFAL